MPKHRIAVLISISSLLFTAGSVPAEAAAKSGAACKKLGLSETISGKKYTCIKSGKKFIWNKGVPVQQPKPTPAVTTVPSIETPTVTPASYLPSPEPLDTCRVPDARRTKTGASGAIAYPRTSGINPPGLPNTGVVNVAVIPIDFSDLPGTGSPSTLIDPELAQVDKWLKQYSNGKTWYKFQTSTTWIRASKTSENYDWVHPGSQGNQLPGAITGKARQPLEIATDLMRDAQDKFDYHNLNVVFFVYPKNVRNIWDAITNYATVPTNVGNVSVQINATGAWLYTNQMPMWAWFLHENLHPTGLAGHAPGDGTPFSIMTNQAGAALGLSAWDQAILDWQRENEIYCVSKENLKDTEIPLNSIDNDNMDGTKSIFIKLSSKEVLVIESHRRAYWSQGWQDYPGMKADLKGLIVYKVDTSVDKNRQEGRGGFAEYQSMTGTNNGMYSGPYSPQFNLNQFIMVGQSMITNGVKIELIHSGIYDNVKVSLSN